MKPQQIIQMFIRGRYTGVCARVVEISFQKRGKDHPPPTQLIKTKPMAGVPSTRGGRTNSSRFNISKNRELQKLPLLKGKNAFINTEIEVYNSN